MRTSINAYETALSKVVAKGHSSNDWVHIVRAETGHFDVRIDNKFNTATEAQVVAEIVSAIHAVQADYQRQYFALRREHFGSGLGFI